MPKRKKPGRPRITGPKRSEVVSVRLTPQERKTVEQAAGEIPIGIWARIAVVRVAREEVGTKRARR